MNNRVRAIVLLISTIVTPGGVIRHGYVAIVNGQIEPVSNERATVLTPWPAAIHDTGESQLHEWLSTLVLDRIVARVSHERGLSRVEFRPNTLIVEAKRS
jgi:hypothetical protein